MNRYFPAPSTSILLLVIWLLLNNSLSFGQVLLGTILAISIPIFTRPFTEQNPSVKRPALAIKQLLVVLLDIITANIQVAILIVGPNKRLRPAFVKVPLDMTDALPITLLASTVSLTPGTVSAEVYPISEEHHTSDNKTPRYLLIHVLDLQDEAKLIEQIKTRYEAPIKEIFGC
ncbi:monovalent cation/H+ antiporter subunit E [Catenovulum agarivorans DS-2]|uniref:Monovalent cation/H+ antiporter subunit E n=1 Tax=Catenovulum agarivorans DS-2 TaxID=1328313 RepID=W7QUX2_9ALTE|nr:Na+/H+ antiporter subunit E [Catenovulum agarivorans]EWH11543.1 monovalent cation/H+ antiporter subunit E [Catenovulum agarivorans DS-2]